LPRRKDKDPFRLSIEETLLLKSSERGFLLAIARARISPLPAPCDFYSFRGKALPDERMLTFGPYRPPFFSHHGAGRNFPLSPLFLPPRLEDKCRKRRENLHGSIFSSSLHLLCRQPSFSPLPLFSVIYQEQRHWRFDASDPPSSTLRRKSLFFWRAG